MTLRLADTAIDQARSTDVVSVALRAGLPLRPGKDYAGPCPHCGGTDRFAISIRKQMFNCRVCGAKGHGAISFVQFLYGTDFRTAVGILIGQRDPVRSALQVSEPAKPDDDVSEKHRQAARLWQTSLLPEGTVVETYVRARRLILPPSPSYVIRFHPTCPRGDTRQPALIALMRHVKSNEPRAIQRIYLTPDGNKDGAMMLGPAGGCAMKITSHWATFWDDINFCPRLFVCEGLETGLSLLRRGLAPVWALGSAGAIAHMPVMFGVGELVICADNDEAGLNAARTCRRQWNATTHQRARIIVPNKAGLDFADKEMLEGDDGE